MNLLAMELKCSMYYSGTAACFLSLLAQRMYGYANYLYVLREYNSDYSFIPATNTLEMRRLEPSQDG